MTWTQFSDAHSGGGSKEQWQHIFIEAAEAEAKVIFYNRFGHNPERVSCTCCGDDYSISESPSLAEATGYERNCNNLATPRLPNGLYDNDLHQRDPWFDAHYYIEPGDEAEARERGYEIEECFGREYGRAYVTLDEYVKLSGVLVIAAAEITPEDRSGAVPEQGYVWAG